MVTMNPRVFLDFTLDGKSIGRVIFELFSDTVPKTSENFRALCTGEKGVSPSIGVPLYFKNSVIHRSIKDFMIQGGDFTKRNGTGGESIYTGTFADEDLSRPLDSEGLLCMANRGPNTNGSQFFITLRPCPHLNGKHVVFGKVIRGFEVVERVANVPVDIKDKPTVPVVVSSCGELELRVPKNVVEEDDRTGKKRRRVSRSRSRSRDSEDGERDKKHKKKSKKKHHRKDKESKPAEEVALGADDPRQETEEEYDARLEREENERKEQARLEELERIKKRHATEQTGSNGVRFKGRGRMKYIDPEMGRR